MGGDALSAGSLASPANSSQFSLVNIVFNYFNDQQENVSGPNNAEDTDKYHKLKRHLESMKLRQTEQMKFMNKQFASLIQNNCAKSRSNEAFNQEQEAKERVSEVEQVQFDEFIEG